jgi:signal recognition particle subunit SRP54
MFGKGGQPAIPDGMDIGNMDPKAMEAAAKQLTSGKGGFPGLGGGLPPGLSGFGKKK